MFVEMKGLRKSRKINFYINNSVFVSVVFGEILQVE